MINACKMYGPTNDIQNLHQNIDRLLQDYVTENHIEKNNNRVTLK